MAEAFTFAISGLLGACLASFLFSLTTNSLQSLLRRSYCDGCGAILKGYRLIPVISSLFLRTRCACSHQPSLKYGLGELTLAAVFFINTYVFGFSYVGALINLLSLIGFYTSLVDWQAKQIPIYSPLLIGILGCFWAYHFNQPPWSVAGISLLCMFLYISGKFFFKRKVIGGGDILLLFAAGIWIPLESLSIFLFLTGLLGIISALIYKRKGREGFPFAPAIQISLWFVLLL